MTSRPFSLFVALAVALWAHVCCCTSGVSAPNLAAPGADVTTSAPRSCCTKHERPSDPSTPAKAPCKDPGSCGRCLEKNLGLSEGATVSLPPAVALPGALLRFESLVPRQEVAVIAAFNPRAYMGTSLLRLHCALIV